MENTVKMRSNHDRILHRLLYSREGHELLNLENVIFGAKEVPHWYGKQLCCETDLLLYTGNIYLFPYHVIEYKSSESDRRQAYHQLKKSEEFVREMFGER